MPSLPEQVTSYLSRAAVGAYAAAYLQLDADGTLHSLGGSLATFGLGHLSEGDVDADALFFLEGLVPHSGPPLFLPCLSFAPDVTADLHLFSEEDRTWALLLDTTVSAHEQRRFQQHLNLRSLSDPPGPRGSDVPALLAETLAALNVLVLEYQDDGTLSVRGLAPEWSHSLFASPGGSPSSVRARGPLSFLGHFLEEARHFWSTAGSGTLRSGLWQEPSTGGTESFFEARALLVNRHRLLLIERIDASDAEL